MKKLKKVIPIIIAFIIGISTTVGAATVFNSKDIKYSSDKTNKTNVKDSLDELYGKVGKCPDGYGCFELTGIAADVELGDYIEMTPTSTSYTPPAELTGCTNGIDCKQAILNPSELNLWRVIKKNEDGTVDIVSHYWPDETLSLYGETGYLNLVKILNEIAQQYTNEKYVSKTRHMGYSNQTQSCSSLSTCPTDKEYEMDINLVKEIDALKSPKRILNSNGDPAACWLPSRMGLTEYGYASYVAQQSGGVGTSPAVLIRASGSAAMINRAYRPILTLKSSVTIKSGDGQSESTAYKLE